MSKNNSKEKAVVIGSGLGGLAVAALLSKKGYSVSVYEKLHEPGGRAREFSSNGYRFDMGPSWYMMPDIFEEFFTLLGENIEDYFQLKKLSPSYRIFLQSSGKQYDFFLTEKKIEYSLIPSNQALETNLLLI